MSKAKRQRGLSPKPPSKPTPQTPLGKIFTWFVVLTCATVLAMLIWYARGILGQVRLAGDDAAAPPRLLIGLFVVMTFGGFVAAAFWAALKRALGRGK